MPKSKVEHKIALTVIAVSVLGLVLLLGWWLGQRNIETGCNDSGKADIFLNDLCAEPSENS